jgi:hypothetical protein
MCVAQCAVVKVRRLPGLSALYERKREKKRDKLSRNGLFRFLFV